MCKLEDFHNQMNEVRDERRKENAKVISKITGKPVEEFLTPEWASILDLYDELKDRKRVAGIIGNGESFIHKDAPTIEEFSEAYESKLWNKFNNEGHRQENEDYELFTEREHTKYLQQLKTLKEGFDFDMDAPLVQLFPFPTQELQQISDDLVCRKCGGDGLPSKALQDRAHYDGRVFIGPSNGDTQNCIKCTKCGHSWKPDDLSTMLNAMVDNPKYKGKK
jgi:hypothetical protein